MLSNKKGIAMLIVIGIVLALVTLAGAAMLVSLSHFSTSSYQLKRARAFYAAEAALQHVLWKCRRGNYNLVPGDNDSITIDGFVIIIGIDPQAPGGINSISAVVDYYFLLNNLWILHPTLLFGVGFLFSNHQCLEQLFLSQLLTEVIVKKHLTK